ncbi:MAG: hypothetical protein IT366_13615 [Candidatus Hydrogenedentes bacterium]|nr:hypothetical protein [Candidatus Hydrogenedentota bacterium]
MRTPFILLIIPALSLVMSGCLADVLVSTAIQGELQAKQLQSATKALDFAKQTKSDIEVNQAIQTFLAEKGRYPASLEELVPDYLPGVPVKPDGSPYGYDPNMGKLTDAPAASTATYAPSLTNEQKMAQITAGINNYAAATGYYPTSLDVLVPTYLSTLPLTAKNARFIYDPTTGKVYDPTGTAADIPVAGAAGDAFAQTPPQQSGGFQQPQRQAGVGGGSPVLGETMTGIGISNQLDNMSTAGSSAAGTSMRQGARGIGQAHDAQQQKAMDDLGL